jgi:hypothetical protein
LLDIRVARIIHEYRAPVHSNLALKAVPGELLFCYGIAFAVEELLVLRKNVIDR